MDFHLWIFTHDTANVCTSIRFAKTPELSPTIVVVYFYFLVDVKRRGQLKPSGIWAQSFFRTRIC